jgi:hypothetical protein
MGTEMISFGSPVWSLSSSERTWAVTSSYDGGSEVSGEYVGGASCSLTDDDVASAALVVMMYDNLM